MSDTLKVTMAAGGEHPALDAVKAAREGLKQNPPIGYGEDPERIWTRWNTVVGFIRAKSTEPGFYEVRFECRGWQPVIVHVAVV